MKTRLIDMMLLEIIRAYEPINSAPTPKHRLAQAKESLFGIKQQQGRESLNDDDAMLEMYRIQLRQHAPALAHTMKAAIARMHGVEFNEPAPPAPTVKSMRQIAREAANKATLFREHMPADKGLEDRLRSKFRKNALSIIDAIELEQIEDGTLPELIAVAQILELLKTLGVDVGRKEKH